MSESKCRFCSHPLHYCFANLGMSPISNAYLTSDKLQAKENFYPLQAFVCEQCFLVQLEEFESPEAIFTDYAYFSSYSNTWLHHARTYAEMITQRLDLNKQSFVVELASNDGYLLKNFIPHQIPVLGIEPAANVAEVANKLGVPTLVRFFGQRTASELVNTQQQADLIIGNNVLAHVPDLNDFVAGMKTLLKPQGSITMEFPHLIQLIQDNQFDTIYHEHFSYFSLKTACRIFAAHGLTLYDVEEIPTHGGSLRIYARHQDYTKLEVNPNIQALVVREEKAGITEISTYTEFDNHIHQIKCELLAFLIEAKRQNKRVVGYGAPAKGNTLLNYCGIDTHFLEYTVDRSPHKQGLYLPGTHIPIYAPDKIIETKPDYVLILPWNIQIEIMSQMDYIREWGGQFVIPIPKLQVI